MWEAVEWRWRLSGRVTAIRTSCPTARKDKSVERSGREAGVSVAFQPPTAQAPTRKIAACPPSISTPTGLPAHTLPSPSAHTHVPWLSYKAHPPTRPPAHPLLLVYYITRLCSKYIAFYNTVYWRLFTTYTHSRQLSSK